MNPGRCTLSRLPLLACLLVLGGCLGMPAGVQPVQDFELQRYLGTWYEVARLDHSFERGLDRVTADYTLRADGGVAVLNRGYDSAKRQWSEAEGKAYFVEDPSTGYLKVSFFGPFYGSYVIFDLDKTNYQYAFISGPDNNYLWLLSRTPTVAPALLERFQQQAQAFGFDVDALIYPSHAALNP